MAGPSSDEELLARYRDLRKTEDFEEIVRRHSDGLGRYLERHLIDRSLAEEVLQETFLRVLCKCGLYRDGLSARSWLYAIAFHLAIDTMRRVKRPSAVRFDSPGGVSGAHFLTELLVSAEPGPLESLQAQESQRWAREALDRLSQPLRLVMLMTYDQELSYEEIAGRLGIPRGTVKSRLYRATLQMREMARREEKS